jgi:long-chain acyl-CoA synthetase
MLPAMSAQEIFVMSMIIELFTRNVERYPDKTAIWFENQIITYKQLFNLANDWSNEMVSNGIKKGDHIGVVLPNNISFVALILAAAKMGAALVPVNPSLPAEAIKTCFQSADVRHVIGLSTALDNLDPVEFPFIKGLWVCIDAETSFAKSLKKESSSENQCEGDEAIGSDEDAFILTMTSGSTGEPKPIILTQENKYRRAMAAAALYAVTADDRVLAATPLYHSLAERLVLMPLIIGATSVIMARFSPSEWLRCVEEQRVTFTIAVSSQLRQIAALLNKPEEKSRARSLRCVVSSSALLEPKVKGDLISRLQCDFHECYGTSEIAIASNLDPCSAKQKLNSVGKAIADVDIKILRDDGRLALLGEPGEIICRTPMLFSGYYKLPVLTQQAMRGEYFRTGDIGVLDSDGFLTFLDRKKDIIITGGINVYPADVEKVVLQNKSIAECAAFAVPDERLGESVGVAVVLRESAGEKFDQKQLQHYCAKHLADFQQPRKYFIIDKLPRNSLGKLTKHTLVEQFAKI